MAEGWDCFVLSSLEIPFLGMPHSITAKITWTRSMLFSGAKADADARDFGLVRQGSSSIAAITH